MSFVVRKGEVSRVHGRYAEAKEAVGGLSLLEYFTRWPRAGNPTDQAVVVALRASRPTSSAPSPP